MANFLSSLNNNTLIKDLSAEDLLKVSQSVPDFVKETLNNYNLKNDIDDLCVTVKNTNNPKLKKHFEKFNLIGSKQHGMRALAVLEMIYCCNRCCCKAPLKDDIKFDNLTQFSVNYGTIPNTNILISINFSRKLGEKNFKNVSQFLFENVQDNAVKSLAYREQIDFKNVGEFKANLMQRCFFVEKLKKVYQSPRIQTYSLGCQERYSEQLKLNYSDFIELSPKSVKDFENTQEKIFAKAFKPIDLTEFSEDTFSVVKTSDGQEVLMLDIKNLADVCDKLQEIGNNEVKFYKSDEQIINHQGLTLQEIKNDLDRKNVVANFQNRLREIEKISLDDEDLSKYGKQVKALLNRKFPGETFVFKKNIDPKDTYLEVSYANPLLQDKLINIEEEIFGKVVYERIMYKFNKELASKEIELANKFGKRLSYGNTGKNLYVENDFSNPLKPDVFDLLYDLTKKDDNEPQNFYFDHKAYYQLPINSDLAQKETFEKYKTVLLSDAPVYLSAADTIVGKPLSKEQIKNFLSELEQSFNHQADHTQKNVKGLSR